MNSTSFFKTLLFSITALVLVSCDKDFNELGSDIIGDDNFDFQLDETTSVIANNVGTGPVQSNNLEINPLGIYTNQVFGKTTANFVTQLELGTLNPTFTNINNPPNVESVTLQIPYYGAYDYTDALNVRVHKLDSIYGPAESKMKLSVYRNRYFLQNIDHEPDGTQQQQRYYSDMDAEINSMLQPGDLLNDDSEVDQNEQFYFNPREYDDSFTDVHNEVVTETKEPGMYLELNKEKFEDWILNAPAGELQNNNVFKNYFRGLYFKVEDIGQPGQLAMLNFKGGKITIRYTEDQYVTNSTATNTDDAVISVHKVLVLNMAGNTVSLLSNSDENINYTAAISQPINGNGVDKLYVKGGHGSIAVIDLFGPDVNTDGIPDELQTLRDNVNQNHWLINEANLTFFVNENTDPLDIDNMNNLEASHQPLRLYLYDIKNRRPLNDYIYDNTGGTSEGLKKVIHSGLKDKNSVGTFYKIRITNYIRDLAADSLNVRLGLSVTRTIDFATMAKLKNANSSLNDYLPTGSVYHQLGTVLSGNNVADEAKKLKLEIYYTKPN